MKSSDVPHLREQQTMVDNRAAEQKAADDKRDADAKSGKAKGPSGPLARAGESGDPEVHKLLADRQAHVSNAGLEPDPAVEAVKKAAKEAIDAIDERLAELGYTAK